MTDSPADQPPGAATSSTPPDLPPPPPEPDKAPKRPTTRAGRRALAAAKATQPKPDKAPKAAKPAPRRAPLKDRLAGSIAGIGTSVVVAGAMTSPAVQADGMLIVEHSANIAEALDRIAKDNPQVAAALERMLTAGVWSGLVVAMTPVAIGVAANHGLIPEGLLAALSAAPADQAPAGG